MYIYISIVNFPYEDFIHIFSDLDGRKKSTVVSEKGLRDINVQQLFMLYITCYIREKNVTLFEFALS